VNPYLPPEQHGAGSRPHGSINIPRKEKTQMTALDMFVPLVKADAARRLVYGVVTAETPDRAGEICDYATTKPYYEKWSAEFHKASAGKSLGNLRAMHGKIAAGRIEQITFDDEARQIEICARIVDGAEWAKVEAGVYTGFSQGGGYVKRWPDEHDPGVTRYTANPVEISLVDMPCLPAATFSMIKSDGATEKRNFAPQIEQVWMTADGKTFRKKAEALAHAGAAPMMRLVERMEDDLSRRAKFAPLKKALGAEVYDSASAIAALEIIFSLLEKEISEGEQDGDQIAALKESIARLKEFVVSEIGERDDEPLYSQKALLDMLTPRLEKLSARIEEIGRQPSPPPMLAGTRGVEKGGDSRLDDIAGALAKLSAEERAALLIKAAQKAPQPLR
jgi:hypothetical protein